MSTRMSSGLINGLRGHLRQAVALLRPEQGPSLRRDKPNRAAGRTGLPHEFSDRPRREAGSRAAEAGAPASLPDCRPLNAAEMNEVERLSAMRAALYPKE